jgi:starch phosphorylase
LGVLAGDHLKSASDLDIPLVGVGLLYQEGYFQQYLNQDGFQQEAYPLNDYSNLPVQPVYGQDGKRLVITVPIATETLHAYVWKVEVGRVSLYLMDANHPSNSAELHNLTDRLYGGDRRTRIRQEILLGIGGLRTLNALGYPIKVIHMNEGHSALIALERIRLFMKAHPGISFDQAQAILATSSVYTIHTPVPAGLERFGYDLIDEHFPWLWKELGLTREEFHELGREPMGGYDLFSMPVMALKMSSSTNGVSALHGVVSQDMWQWMFPHVPLTEVPIEAITNGIHMQTWVSGEVASLFDRYLDPAWRVNAANEAIWAEVDRIPDTELWRAHERRRARLCAFTRNRLKKQLILRGSSQTEIEEAEEVLNPDALTIGFARRFATYKRATLLFHDPERLHRIINNPDRPVQFIFAGKAHPHDNPGKELIREIVNYARLPEFRHAIVFLENYDMTIARYLVQGVDLWLNTPRRPKEASGTSGMKVIYNGGLNCSVLDGWWAEAYSPEAGWAIGKGERYSESDAKLQDYIESQALYNLLERDIVPLFYDRGRDNLPRGWMEKVKFNIRTLSAFFTTDRMVEEYTTRYYMRAADQFDTLTRDGAKAGVDYAKWRARINATWSKIRVHHVKVSTTALHVGESADIEAWIDLGQLSPQDVLVQVYAGNLDTSGKLIEGHPYVMEYTGETQGSVYKFMYTMNFVSTGEHGLTVRVLPFDQHLTNPILTGLIHWAS